MTAEQARREPPDPGMHTDTGIRWALSSLIPAVLKTMFAVEQNLTSAIIRNVEEGSVGNSDQYPSVLQVDALGKVTNMVVFPG